MARTTDYKGSEMHRRIQSLINGDANVPLKWEPGNSTSFADYIGRSKQMVNYWYNGKRTPGFDVIILISKMCGVSTDWILGEEPFDNTSKDMAVKEIAQYTGLSSAAIDVLHTWSAKLDSGKKLQAYWVEMISDLIESESEYSIFSLLWAYMRPEFEPFILVNTNRKRKNGKPRSLGSFRNNEVYIGSTAGQIPLSVGLVSRYNFEALQNGLADYKKDAKNRYEEKLKEALTYKGEEDGWAEAPGL